MGLVAVGALMLTACGGSGPTRADAVAELVGAGFTQDTAECMMDDLADQGVEPGDLTGTISPEIDVAIDRAVNACISAADVGSLIASSDEVRDQLIDGMMESGVVDREQAECVVASLEATGADLVELFTRDDFDAQLDAAIAECL